MELLDTRIIPASFVALNPYHQVLEESLISSATHHGGEPTEPPREWNSQSPESYFKSKTSPPKNSPVVSDIMGRLNHQATDNGDVDVHPSELPV